MSKKITIKQIGEHKGEYVFWINEQKEEFIISIPGFGGGRDGPINPNFPEQEKWMRDHSNLKEVWYLTWQCNNQEELDCFLDKLKSLNQAAPNTSSESKSKPKKDKQNDH